MTACSYCIASGPRPMHPMVEGGEEEILEEDIFKAEEMVASGRPVEDEEDTANRTALPFGFGILVGPNGVLTDPSSSNVPRSFVDPADGNIEPVIGPRGPRMFLITFSDPSPVVMAPPSPEVEDAHVARVGELYKAGRLHFVGHQANGKEGYMLLSAKTLPDAWTIAQTDPLIEEGYFRSVDVKEIEGPYPWHRYGGPQSAS
jgi:uncharacterized protein YciI